MSVDLTPDETLFTLNDWCGRLVSAEVRCDRGGFTHSVFKAVGVLRHWQATAKGAALGAAIMEAGGSVEGEAGRYQIGPTETASVNLTGLDAVLTSAHGDVEELMFPLGDGVELRILSNPHLTTDDPRLAENEEA